MHDPALVHWLHRITRPALVLWGEKDGIVAPSYGERLAAALPNASFETDRSGGALPADRTARRGCRRDRTLCLKLIKAVIPA